jgi:hypothetical protein
MKLLIMHWIISAFVLTMYGSQSKLATMVMSLSRCGIKGKDLTVNTTYDAFEHVISLE